MADVVEEIRCALAMQDAGYAVLFDHKTSAELLRRYDALVHSVEVKMSNHLEVADLMAENARLRDYLAQIEHVCRDNAPESCNQRMALDFVHQVATAALSSGIRKSES